MTFNVAHGEGFNTRYNLQNAIDLIARVQPDLIGVQELTRNHPAYACDDQPALIAEGLTAATGRAWRHVYKEEWFTPDRTCLDRGVGDAAESEGLAFLAPASVDDVTMTRLQNSRIAMRARSGGSGVPVVVTHLASGTAGFSDRVAQFGQLVPWAQGAGVPRILIGDLNAVPESPELQPVLSEYRDAWADALLAGTARGVMSGDTRIRGGRIDHVLYTGDTLKVESAEIVDSTASDHRPLVVRFRVR
jgi:endonuclease/exonuclease/phosphatase family metal-dependent hydrolase